MALNPQKETEIITGGQDENCFIWDIIDFDASECINDSNKNNAINEEKKQEENNNDNDNNKLYTKKKTEYF